MADEQTPDASQADDGQDGTQTPQDGGAADKKDSTADIDALRAEIGRLRKEAAKHRTDKQTERSQADTLKSAIAKALGIEKDEVDPAQVAKELAEAKQDLRNERIMNAFLRVAGTLDADPELTMAYMAHKRMFDDLDPKDDGFEDDLKDKVKAVLKANAKLKVVPSAHASGSDKFSGDKKNPSADMNNWLRRSAGLAPRD